MSDRKKFADASNQAYEDLFEGAPVFFDKVEYRVDKVFIDRGTGLKGYAFKQRFGDEIIVSFAGTDEVKDWYYNVTSYGTDQYLSQRQEIISYIKSVSNSAISFTGHSLGAALSAYALYDAVAQGILTDPTKLKLFTYSGLGALYGVTDLVRNRIFGEIADANFLSRITSENLISLFDIVPFFSPYITGKTYSVTANSHGAGGLHEIVTDETRLNAAEPATHRPLARDPANAIGNVIKELVDFVQSPTGQDFGQLIDAIRDLPIIQSPLVAAWLVRQTTVYAASYTLLASELAIATAEIVIKVGLPAGPRSPELDADIDNALITVQQTASKLADSAIATFSATAAKFAGDGDVLAEIALDVGLRTGLNAFREAASSALALSAIDGIRDARGILYDVSEALWTGMGVKDEGLVAELGINAVSVGSAQLSALLRSAILKAIAAENLEGVSGQAADFLVGFGADRVVAALVEWSENGFKGLPEYDFSFDPKQILPNVATQIGTKIGTKIAEGLVHIDNQGEALTFTVGSSVGGMAGAQLGATLLAGFLFPGVGHLLGAIAGSALGGVVGEFIGDWLLDDVLGIELHKLFGDDGRFQFQRWHTLQDGQVVQPRGDWWKDAPQKVHATVSSMSDAFEGMIESYAAAMGGKLAVTDGGELTQMVWNTDQKLHIYLKGAGGGMVQSYDPSALIQRAAVHDLKRLGLSEADPIMQRAFGDWKAKAFPNDAAALSELTRVLEAAGAYRKYLENPADSNKLIALDPTSALAVEILSKMYTIVEFGLDRGYTLTGTAAADTIGGADGADRIEGGLGDDTLRGYGGADDLFGNDGADVLFGGSGSDRLDGGDGIDTAVFSGKRAEYVASAEVVDGVKRVQIKHAQGDQIGIDGTDTISGVEKVRFADGEVDLTDLVPISTIGIVGPTASVAEGQSGQREMVFTVGRTGDLSGVQTVGWSVVGGTATAADFGANAVLNGLLTFRANEATQTIRIVLKGDTSVELDETVVVGLSGPTAGAAIGTATATGTIRNDDAQITLSATPLSLTEGHAGARSFDFVVTRTGDTSTAHTAEWRFKGVTADAQDFVGGRLPAGTVSFAAGETRKVVSVQIAGDQAYETDETFVLTLDKPSSGASLGTAATVGIIRNDDAQIALSTTSLGLTESNSGARSFDFVVTRTGDTSTAHTAEWQIKGGSADARDFVGGRLPTGTVSFAAGETRKVISVQVAGDQAYEADETFVLTLGKPSSGASLGAASATGTIRNDDVQPGTFSISPYATPYINLSDVTESHSGHAKVLIFTISRDGDASKAQSVKWGVVGGTADKSDLLWPQGLPSGTATFKAGERSQVISFSVSGDDQFERDETVVVGLSGPTAGAVIGTATVTGIIRNDDAQIALSATPLSLTEGHAGARSFDFVVTRIGDTSTAQTAEWQVKGGTADARDFVGGRLPTGTVSFAAGETRKVVSVQIAGDQTYEANETFVLTLGKPSSGASLGTATATGIIRNDDAQPGTFSIAAKFADAPESHLGWARTMVYTVTRAGDASKAQSVKWGVVGGTADKNDLLWGQGLPSGTVTFKAGERSQDIYFNVSGDNQLEPDETVVVGLSSATAGAMIGTATATGIIRNDDAKIALTKTSVGLPEGQSGSKSFDFVVSRTGDTTTTHTAQWQVKGGTATAGDFLGGKLPTGSVSFTPGETSKTISVKVLGEQHYEKDETFILTLSNPSTGANLGTAIAVGTIQNDDTAGIDMQQLVFRAFPKGKAQGQGSEMRENIVVSSGIDIAELAAPSHDNSPPDHVFTPIQPINGTWESII